MSCDGRLWLHQVQFGLVCAVALEASPENAASKTDNVPSTSASAFSWGTRKLNSTSGKSGKGQSADGSTRRIPAGMADAFRQEIPSPAARASCKPRTPEALWAMK